MMKHITMETLQDVVFKTHPKSLGIADLGCSSGPNTLSIIRDMVRTVILSPTTTTLPEFRIYLNDLPANDFNTIFRSLPDFYWDLNQSANPFVFVAGYPGSFYGRLFPANSLHFVYSSYSLHWLSRVPQGVLSMNKGNIYISENSPTQVSEAYFRQFKNDFQLFLRTRAEELVNGGRMVLIFLGRLGPNHVDRGNSFFWEILRRSLLIMSTQGEVEKKKIDTYHVHFYAASKDEVEEEVRNEGSFEMDRFEMFEIEKEGDIGGRGVSYGTTVAMTVRAIQESMISRHFGEGVVERLFEIYGRLVDEEMEKEDIKPITFLVVLRKKAMD
ncbi:probable methyltransferase TCM_000336 [Impatiens glandulifera]|uniref:probable methyltransferase TCM_000336 n=1 Tax=Impatiens glandulifera TaxID=253017 RepID=UPI001FB04CCF|nr:probable methyltransferase TCM_000336 [Impatiens glandulifera]